MKKILLFAIGLLLLASCNSTVKTNDSTQNVVQSGTSYTYVVVRLEFIGQIQQICQDSILKSSYPDDTSYNQAVAQCTLQYLSILNFNPTQLTDFVQKYCQSTSDLSTFTPQQQTDILAACGMLGSH